MGQYKARERVVIEATGVTFTKKLWDEPEEHWAVVQDLGFDRDDTRTNSILRHIERQRKLAGTLLLLGYEVHSVMEPSKLLWTKGHPDV